MAVEVPQFPRIMRVTNDKYRGDAEDERIMVVVDKHKQSKNKFTLTVVSSGSKAAQDYPVGYEFDIFCCTWRHAGKVIPNEVIWEN